MFLQGQFHLLVIEKMLDPLNLEEESYHHLNRAIRFLYIWGENIEYGD